MVTSNKNIGNLLMLFLFRRHMVAMPKLTAEGYQILVYRLADTEPSKLQFTEAVKMFCMFNDYRISCDGLAEGYVVLFDMKGVRLGHLARVQLGALRTFMVYIQVSFQQIIAAFQNPGNEFCCNHRKHIRYD